jgi:hypothetical protein
MPIIRSTEVNQKTVYDVQHWSCCVRLAEKRQVRVHLLGVKRRPVLYVISGLLVHFCTPDDGYNDAQNLLSQLHQ